MGENRNIPVGLTDFSRLRSLRAPYADKSGFIAPLLGAGPRLILRRPAGFGKTLLLSMLEAYFSGRRECFSGLAAGSAPGFPPEAREVIRLDLAAGFHTTPAQLSAVLLRHTNFRRIRQRHPGRLAPVLLVDNLDAPLALGPRFADPLRRFLLTILASDDIHFALLTATRRTCRKALAPAADGFRDISADPCFATLCGITRAEAMSIGAGDIYPSCGGYHFAGDGSAGVAPADTLIRMAAGTADLPPRRFDIPLPGSAELLGLRETLARDFDVEHDGPAGYIGDLLDAGVLTRRGADPGFGICNYGFPNPGVEKYFFSRVLGGKERDISFTTTSVRLMASDLRRGSPEDFLRRMQSLLGSMGYELRRAGSEAWYQGVFYCVTRLLGLYAMVEVSTSGGRIDMMAETPDFVYIFEFKHDGTPRGAVLQIIDRGYADRWAADPRKLFMIGVNFSSATHNISGWHIEAGAPARKEVRP